MTIEEHHLLWAKGEHAYRACSGDTVEVCIGGRFECVAVLSGCKDRHFTHPREQVALWRALCVVLASCPTDAQEYGGLTDEELAAVNLAIETLSAPEPKP